MIQQGLAVYLQTPSQPVVRSKSRLCHGDGKYCRTCLESAHKIGEGLLMWPDAWTVANLKRENDIAERPVNKPG